jgi:hypothetical protein
MQHSKQRFRTDSFDANAMATRIFTPRLVNSPNHFCSGIFSVLAAVARLSFLSSSSSSLTAASISFFGIEALLEEALGGMDEDTGVICGTWMFDNTLLGVLERRDRTI